MATGKSSFLLYADLIHTLEKMPDDKAGLLFKHILRYVNDLNPETDDLVVQLTFEPIKQQLKRDLKKYEGTIHAKSEGGQWGNLKKWHPEIYKQAKEKDLSLSDAMRLVSDVMRPHTEPMPSHPIASIAVNDTVNDTVNDSVTDNVSVSDSVIIKKKSIEERKEEFREKLDGFRETYSQSMLDNFFNYWTEHGDKDIKMRFEKEKVFGLAQRLVTWKNRQRDFEPKTANTGKTPLTEDIGDMDYSKTTF